MSQNSKINSESRLVRFYNENKYILLTGAIAFIITQLVAFCYDLVPYGDMTVLRMDLYHQYGPLFAELYDRLTNGSSLIYSWNSGLGSSFLGNYFNYLSSPLSLIVVLFGHENITEAISFLMMLKAILSSMSFAYYLKKSHGINTLLLSGFGIMYAFCGYFVAYYWNVMWIDAMVLFPIIILGIERIIDTGKAGLYCVSLAVMIFSNYYMAYMICLFAIFYFPVYYFSKYTLTQKFTQDITGKNPFKKAANSLFISAGFKFAIFSLTAALTAAVAILPLTGILSQSSATSGSGPTSLIKYFTVFDFLANHLAGPEATIRSSGDTVLPNVYCGILTVLLAVLYLYSTKISLREKISHLLLLGLIYFSFNINYLNFVWHGFHFPNDLPYRFSFMYCFILLSMAFRVIINISEFSSKQLLSVGIGLIGFIILVEKTTSKNVDNKVLLLSLIYAVGYVIALRLLKNMTLQNFSVSILILCIICSEVALSTTSNYSMNQSKTNYTSDYNDFRQLKKQLDERENNGFYRMELTDLRTRMDPCWFGYNGISVFSSMAYESVANVQQKLGIYGNYINSYTYMPQTPVYNTLFALKYIADKSGTDMTNGYYSPVARSESFTAYENSCSLPVAFAASSKALDWDAYSYTNPFIAQSELFASLSGAEQVLRKLEVENTTYTNINNFYSDEFESGEFRFSKINDNQSASVCFEVTPEETENVYLYIDSKNIESVTVNSAMETKSVTALDEPHITDLGTVSAGQTLFVDIEFKTDANYGGLDFSAFTLDDGQFLKGYETLKNGQLVIDSYSDTYLAGDLSAGNDSIVFTSIPYDANWEIYVDGAKLPSDRIYSISKAFLAFSIDEGEHRVIINYRSKGLISGAFISCVTIILLTVFTLISSRRRKEDKWELMRVSCTVSGETDNNPVPDDVHITFKQKLDSFLEETNVDILETAAPPEDASEGEVQTESEAGTNESDEVQE